MVRRRRTYRRPRFGGRYDEFSETGFSGDRRMWNYVRGTRRRRFSRLAPRFGLGLGNFTFQHGFLTGYTMGNYRFARSYNSATGTFGYWNPVLG